MINVDHIQKKYLLSDLYLRQPIQKIQIERKGTQQAIITRMIALLATSFFQAIDFLYNICMAIGKLPLAALKNMGVKQLDSKEFSFTSVGQHFALAGKCLLGTVTGSIGGAINPSYISFLCSNKGSNAFPKIEVQNKYRSEVQALPKELRIDHQKLAKSFLEKEGKTTDHNLHLNDFFGHVYLVNLEKCVDKKNSILKHLKQVGLDEKDIDVFKATYGKDVYNTEERKRMKDNSFGIDESTKEGQEKLDKQHAGQMGCWKSHERIIRHAKEHYDAALNAYKSAQKRGFVNDGEKRSLAEQVKRYSNILIFEDDARLGFVNEDKKTSTLENLKQSFWTAMKELPEDWDMFYLLPFRIHPLKEQDHSHTQLVREDYALTTSTFAVNAKAYDVILQELDKINQSGVDLRPVDHAYAKLHEKIQCFGPKKRPFALQDATPSDISGLDRVVSELFQPMNFYN